MKMEDLIKYKENIKEMSESINYGYEDICKKFNVSYPTLKKFLIKEKIQYNKKNSLDDRLIGQKYGRLTVIKLDHIGKNNRKYYLCKCNCGKEIITAGTSLISGITKSCGCLKYEYEDLTGKIFGFLEVLEISENKYNDYGRITWKCKCLNCGNITYKTAEILKRGDAISCGCVHSIGELNISKILFKNNINFKKEYSFSDLKSEKNRALRFDFAIFNDDNSLLYLIEFDGKQHFNKNTRYYSKTMVEHDKIKNEYCKNNGIPLIRIPYYLRDKIKFEDIDINTSKYII